MRPEDEVHLLNPKSLWSIWDWLQSESKWNLLPNPPSSGFLGLGYKLLILLQNLPFFDNSCFLCSFRNVTLQVCSCLWICPLHETHKKVPLLWWKWKLRLYHWWLAPSGCWKNPGSCPQHWKWHRGLCWRIFDCSWISKYQVC